VNLRENILLTLKVKRVKFCPFFKFFLVRRKLPFFGQNCSLPFSSRSLDNPALLKSWQKHYKLIYIPSFVAGHSSCSEVSEVGHQDVK
jgi:hypothetical protein